MALEPLFHLGPYRIAAQPGTAPDLVIAFASVGHDPARPPSPEFVGHATAGGRPALFVMDETRSWATAPGFAQALTQALDMMRTRQPIRRILTLGASMGGFCALCAAQVLPVTAALAIGPQSRPAAAWEHRWRLWTDRLPPDLTAPFPETWTILLHGLPDDAAQANGFPQRKGVDHLLLPGIPHSDLAQHLKSQGGLQGLIDAALQGDRRRLLRIAANAGANRR